MNDRDQIVPWVELIEVRSIQQNSDVLSAQLKILLSSVDTTEYTLKVYERATLKTDFALQLFHTSERGKVGKSPLGLLISSQLKDFGLVNHSVWIEYDGARIKSSN